MTDTRFSNFYYFKVLVFIVISFALKASFSQRLSNSAIKFNNTEHDYGKVELANSLVSKFIITNTGSAKLYVLRADAQSEYKISITKKTIMPADTALLTVTYEPKNAGVFSQTIRVFTNAEAEPVQLYLKGELKKLDDDKTQCFYFGQDKKIRKPEQVLIPAIAANKTDKPLVTEPEKIIIHDTANAALPLSKYKPNHVVFLIDVSRSMRDSLKLPLLKVAIEKLINSLRSVDKLSLVAYNDTATVIGAAIPATDRDKIIALMQPIKANGRTNGSKGIKLAHRVATDNFLEGANNQIILATDGVFILSDKDYKLFTSTDKKIILSVLGFGDDKKYLTQLSELAQKGNGHYIHLASKEECNEALLNEIKQNSERK